MKNLQSSLNMQPFWTRIILLFILAYEGLGGLVGGFLLIARPDGSLMQMPVELMHGIFENFMIPGIILTAMAIVSLISFFKVLRKKHNDWIWACIGLCGWYIWFVTEILILQELHWLHLMWGAPIILGIITAIPLVAGRNNNTTMFKILLLCGIFSSLWYTFMNFFVPVIFQGYSANSQTVSELSAIGAPSRILWVLLSTIYPLLYAAFGWGIIRIFGNNKKLKIIAALIIAYSIINIYWPPMHSREAIASGYKSLTDILHITWAVATGLLFISTMGIGATVFDNKFRQYSILSIILLIVFGILTSMHVPDMEANQPTPMMGIWERINQYIFFLWVIVFSIKLMRNQLKQNYNLI